MTYGLLALLAVYIVSRKSYTIWRSDTKKYLTRWYFFGKWFRKLTDHNLFLHHFHASDDEEFHNHRWSYGYSLILWGGYLEMRRMPIGTTGFWRTHVKIYRPFSIVRLDADWFHRVELLNEKRGCWSLFLAGPFANSDWGFLRDDGTTEYAQDRFRGRKDALSDD